MERGRLQKSEKIFLQKNLKTKTYEKILKVCEIFHFSLKNWSVSRIVPNKT